MTEAEMEVYKVGWGNSVTIRDWIDTYLQPPQKPTDDESTPTAGTPSADASAAALTAGELGEEAANLGRGKRSRPQTKKFVV